MRRSAAAIAIPLLTLAGCGGGSSSSATASRTGTTSAPKTQPANPPPSTVTTAATTSENAPAVPAKIRRLVRGRRSPSETAKLALTSTTSLVCTLYTPKLLESSFGGQSGCRSAVGSGGRAKSVKIVSTDTHGSSATVVAVPQGGPSSGEMLTISLAHTNGRWQLTGIKSNVKVGP